MTRSRSVGVTIWMATVAVALAGTSGCADTVCSGIAADYGLVLRLDSGSVVGEYQVQVEAERQLLLVDYRVEEKHRVEQENPVVCSEGCRDLQGNLQVAPLWGYPSSFSGNDVRLTVVHLDDPDRGPDELQLKIFRDLVVVHDASYQPQYITREPSGEGCGELDVAVLSIAMPP